MIALIIPLSVYPATIGVRCAVASSMRRSNLVSKSPARARPAAMPESATPTISTQTNWKLV
jgi:hypothetical protein